MANGFYQEHTGLLLTLFIVIFINFFYTSVLNQTHLTEDQIIQNALKLVITTVSEPLGVVFFVSLCFLYSVKSWQYVTGRLKGADAQFLYYSSTSLGRARQVQSWSIVQLVISLPIIVLGLFATIIGFVFGHWIIPLLLPVYLIALILYSASYYTRLINNAVAKPAKIVRLVWLRNWPKPFFSLFLYEVISKKRITYAITKLASAISIALIFNIFPGTYTDIRLIGIMSLCSAVTHVLLIYQSSEFELFYLRFARNFPYSHWHLYCQQGALYSLLLLPEIIWFLVAGEFNKGLIGAFLMLSITLLFRALLYRLGQQMDYYLRSVFGLFIFFLLTILFGFTELLAVGNAVAAWVLLHRYQYQSLG
ncbi:hypothetical protein GO730_09555 [Spirosoma sp. HMF3257]|uniref:Uncharacterized protein n=1 Tax=Spirosoma telluris TaxID=2183553 RepID=A0A327NKJ8_9BACT|nr:hypothetical protein [Spirosoma telluris]RAI74444.1 hypothetical protein HMF3257_09460 [Spirosoma telluris]